jgi:hypothetical protein
MIIIKSKSPNLSSTPQSSDTASDNDVTEKIKNKLLVGVDPGLKNLATFTTLSSKDASFILLLSNKYAPLMDDIQNGKHKEVIKNIFNSTSKTISTKNIRSMTHVENNRKKLMLSKKK